MRKFLLYSSALFAGGLLNGVANAACIQTPTCSSLGYESSTACEGGLKCPFGNAWNCTFVEKITELEKVIENLQQSANSNCQPGYILYSDKTCSLIPIDGKTAIGIILFNKSDGTVVARALNKIEVEQVFADPTKGVDLINKMGSYSEYAMDSCEQTKKIISADSSKTFTPVWKVNEYSTAGTNKGDWCLPAPGLALEIVRNRASISYAIQEFSTDGESAKLSVGITTYFYSESQKAQKIDIYSEGNSYGIIDRIPLNYYNSAEVIPILEFKTKN